MNKKDVLALALFSLGVGILLWLGILYAPIATLFLIGAMIVRKIITPSFSSDEILLALHHTEWRTKEQILRELARIRKIPYDKIKDVKIGEQMQRLLDKMLVEMRSGAPHPYLIGGVEYFAETFEYRLLSNGLHRKIKIEQALPDDVPLGKPADEAA